MVEISILSDERLVSQTTMDIAVKYFLGLDPEDPMVDFRIASVKLPSGIFLLNR